MTPLRDDVTNQCNRDARAWWDAPCSGDVQTSVSLTHIMLILTITALTSDNFAGVTRCFADVMQILSDVVCVSFTVCFDLDFCCWMLVLCAAIMSDLSIKSYWLHSCLCSTRCSRQKPGALVLLSRYQYRITDRVQFMQSLQCTATTIMY